MSKGLEEALRCGYGLTSNRKSGLPDGYFPHWEYNVYGNEMDERFLRMFNRGSGGELDKKACAVHSSSMLSYNFFHWISDQNALILSLGGKDVKFTKVFFEVQMRTLKSSRQPANMDVLLVSDDEAVWLMLESKFTEYLSGGKFEISDSYCETSNYFNDQGAAWVEFMSHVKNLMRGNKRYFEGIKQNICHMIGIRNLICSGSDLAVREFFNDANDLTYSPGTKIYFRNIVFRPDTRSFVKEYARYNDYFNLWSEFSKVVEEYKGLSMLDIGFVSYSKLWQLCKGNLPNDLKEFLQHRYMQFAGIDEPPV